MKRKGFLVILVVTLMALIISSCGGGGPKLVPVTAITITSEDDKESIYVGETLQLFVQVNPENATNKAVEWSVENALGNSSRVTIAEISEQVILKGLTEGTVIVKATAKDGSGIFGVKEVHIIQQEPETYNISIEASPTEGGNVSFDNTSWSDSDSQTVEEGTDIDIYVQTDDEYIFEGWYEGDTYKNKDNPYTVTVNTDKTLTAVFKAKEYDVPTVTLTTPEDGIEGIDPQNPPTLQWQAQAGEQTNTQSREEPTLTKYEIYMDTNPNPTTLVHTINDPSIKLWEITTELAYGQTYYWKVKAFQSDGKSATSETRSFSTITQYTLTIEASPTEGGTVSGEGTYEAGTDVNITATENAGYRLFNWTRDGNAFSTQTNLTYTMPAEDVILVGNFEGEINFEDPVLEQAVRDAQGYTGAPTGPIYQSDVFGITTLQYIGSTSPRETQLHHLIPEWEKGKSYHVPLNQETEDSEQNMVPRAKITSLEGIQYLTNLTSLDFSDNSVSDISPIQNLTNLTRLYFDNNNVSDISPLQNLTNLTFLGFYNNSVSNISPIQHLNNLQYLNFSNNQVSDITPVQKLTNLEDLSFYSNIVSNITPVQNLTNLEGLYLWENLVIDITPVQNLTNLKGLHFGHNLVNDITPVQNLIKLQWLMCGDYISDVSPVQNLTEIQWLGIGGSQLSDISPLQNLINLNRLSFRQSKVSDISPLQDLINLVHLDFAANQVSDISPLQNLINLVHLDFAANQVSDLSPLQNLSNLTELWFGENSVSDIQPLVNNTGLGDEDEVSMRYNNLDLTPGSQNMNDINTLIGRGVNVDYEPQN